MGIYDVLLVVPKVNPPQECCIDTCSILKSEGTVT